MRSNALHISVHALTRQPPARCKTGFLQLRVHAPIELIHSCTFINSLAMNITTKFFTNQPFFQNTRRGVSLALSILLPQNPRCSASHAMKVSIV
jgi:hypothetical protein